MTHEKQVFTDTGATSAAEEEGKKPLTKFEFGMNMATLSRHLEAVDNGLSLHDNLISFLLEKFAITDEELSVWGEKQRAKIAEAEKAALANLPAADPGVNPATDPLVN